MDTKNIGLIFRCQSTNDCLNNSKELFDLFQRCEATNKLSAYESGNKERNDVSFHGEFTNYLRNMEQYSKSLCFQWIEPHEDKVIAAVILNLKEIYMKQNLINAGFYRLMRVDPNWRRKQLILNLAKPVDEILKKEEINLQLGYTLITNNPSLNLSHSRLDPPFKTTSLLDTFVLPTESSTCNAQSYKLSQEETENLFTNKVSHWKYRPSLADLRRILEMQEYQGTFAIGDVGSKQFSAVSVWQPSSTILCDDRAHTNDKYRGRFWVLFNFYPSPMTGEAQNTVTKHLLSSINHAAAKKDIPFVLCHVEQSSPMNSLCRQQAIAVATEIYSQRILSSHIADAEGQSQTSPVWLDPRDFSSLLYFKSLSSLRFLPKFLKILKN